MPTDIFIDLRTNDFVDDPSGDGWLETDDSRTAVRMQLDAHFRKWWGDPDTGSRFAEMRQSDDPTTAEQLRDEAIRALQVLVNEGLIGNVSVSIDDQEGTFVQLLIVWQDLATDHSADMVYAPFESARIAA